MQHSTSWWKLTRTGVLLGLVLWGLSGLESAMAQELIIVNCNNPAQTLGQAVATAKPGDTIQVTGTCTEMVTITTDRLTIDGQGNAIIDGGGGFPVEPVLAGVLAVDGASGVHLKGLTVQNGPDGILIMKGGSARVTDVISQGHGDEGLQMIEGATATFNGMILSQNNGDDGIGVFHASSLTINSGSTVQSLNNGDDGISVFASSSIRVPNGTLQLDNNGRLDEFGDGFAISGTSTVRLAGTTTVNVNQNANRGVLLSSASALFLADTSAVTLTNNGDDGIGIFNVSRFSLGSGTMLRSESNAATGLVVSSIAIASCSADSIVTLINNTDGPSFVSSNSQVSTACFGTVTTNLMQRTGDAASIGPIDEQETH